MPSPEETLLRASFLGEHYLDNWWLPRVRHGWTESLIGWVLWAVIYNRPSEQAAPYNRIKQKWRRTHPFVKPYSLKIRKSVAKLRGGKVLGLCNIDAALLKTGGAFITQDLDTSLMVTWQYGTTAMTYQWLLHLTKLKPFTCTPWMVTLTGSKSCWVGDERWSHTQL